MKRLLLAALLALMLTGCKPVFIPGMYGPHLDHTLQCLGGNQGECRLGNQGSFGKL